MSTQILYLSQIRTVLPAVTFEQVEQTSGQFNDIVILNSEWVFRFPRYRAGVAALRSETRLLDALRGRLPLAVPEPVYRSFDPPVPGLAFMGYRRLPGEPLYAETLAGVADEWARDDLAGQLAAFLRALHSLPVADLHTSEGLAVLPQVQDRRDQWAALYGAARDKLYPAMRPDARREVTAHFERYLDDPALHNFTPTLRHGDFGGSNILWDPLTRFATAVIDFSACALGDPALDLASISTMGLDFYDRLVPRYEPDPSRRSVLLARARFYSGTFALMEALDGLRDNDRQAYERGMEAYR